AGSRWLAHLFSYSRIHPAYLRRGRAQLEMFQRFIENRERAHHGRDSNRKTLPFEWGLEHVGLPTTNDPESALRGYANTALADSDAFYAFKPTTDYTFDGH